MTPTEKHRETAREVVMGWATSDGLVGLEDRVASTLANAEREGMKRAAEIARNSGPATQDITSTMICDALDHAADLILSEAGEGA